MSLILTKKKLIRSKIKTAQASNKGWREYITVVFAEGKSHTISFAADYCQK